MRKLSLLSVLIPFAAHAGPVRDAAADYARHHLRGVSAHQAAITCMILADAAVGVTALRYDSELPRHLRSQDDNEEARRGNAVLRAVRVQHGVHTPGVFRDVLVGCTLGLRP